MSENTHHLVNGEIVDLTPEEKFELDALAEQSKTNPVPPPAPVPTREQMMHRISILQSQMTQLVNLAGMTVEGTSAQPLIITGSASSSNRSFFQRLTSAISFGG